jgi:hypothetical protein
MVCDRATLALVSRVAGPSHPVAIAQLSSYDRNFARRLDPEANLPLAQTHDRDAYVVTDEQLFQRLARKYEHVQSSDGANFNVPWRGGSRS